MRAPGFWAVRHGRAAAPMTRALLTPLSWLYGAAVQHKIRQAGTRVGVPVICIGNLSVGGTGKTPVVRRLAQQLIVAGHRPVVLSRGYGGALSGPVWVDSSQHTATDVGDEPLMLTVGGIEVMIARDRLAGAHMIAASGRASHILLDDGMQNPHLHKDHIIVVIDAAQGFGNHHLLPAGPLREPIAPGLARADGLVVIGAGDTDADLIAAAQRPVVHARLHPLSPPPPGPLLAFAGIGRPQKVFDSIRGAGGQIVDSLSFPDHHPYTLRDMARLRALATHHGAQLITTEKDWIRLPAAQRHGIHRFDVALADSPSIIDLIPHLCPSTGDPL